MRACVAPRTHATLMLSKTYTPQPLHRPIRSTRTSPSRCHPPHPHFVPRALLLPRSGAHPGHRRPLVRRRTHPATPPWPSHAATPPTGLGERKAGAAMARARRPWTGVQRVARGPRSSVAQHSDGAESDKPIPSMPGASFQLEIGDQTQGGAPLLAKRFFSLT